MTETITAVIALMGGGFALLGAIGLVRMPDVMIRMHASTKIGTLACGLTLIAAAVFFGQSDITIRVIAIILFLLLTAPIGAHMIGRSAISTGVKLWRIDYDPKAKLDDAHTPETGVTADEVPVQR